MVLRARPRHLSEQYFTLSQTFSHFLRHVNGLPQVAQVLVGRLDLATPRILAFRAQRGAPTVNTNHLPSNPARIRR
jgi:hypothetical protein